MAIIILLFALKIMAQTNPGSDCYIDNSVPGFPVEICPSTCEKDSQGNCINPITKSAAQPSQPPAQPVQQVQPVAAPVVAAPQPAYAPVAAPPPKNHQNAVKKRLTLKGSTPDKPHSLKEIEKQYPSLVSKLNQILSYNGIMVPWDRVRDFLDDTQQPMPSPKAIYNSIREMVALLHTVSEHVSDQVNKVDIYIGRAKQYLKEDRETLTHYLEKLKILLDKVKNTKDPAIRAEYMNNFNKINEKTQKKIISYKTMNSWLKEMVADLKQLFQ